MRVNRIHRLERLLWRIIQAGISGWNGQAVGIHGCDYPEYFQAPWLLQFTRFIIAVICPGSVAYLTIL
jgi:hypothetical protein